MKGKNSKRAITLSVLMLVQLAISSMAPFVASVTDGYLKVSLVKLVYAFSFVAPYVLWKRSFKPVGVSFAKHIYCEYKKPAFFVAFAAIVTFLQINIVFLELIPSDSTSSSGGMFEGFFGFLFSLLMYALVPALTEELFSRGVVMRICGGGVKAAVLSGVLFGLCHFNPSQLIYSIGAGVVLGLLCLYTNDIKMAVYLHLCVNTTVLILSYLAMILPVGFYVAIECILWLAVLGLGIYYSNVLLRDYQRQIQQRGEEIKKNKEDIRVAEIFSPAMLVVYGAILVATVLRYI